MNKPYYVDNDGQVVELGTNFKTPYNHDTTIEAVLSATENTDPSMTKQSEAADTDINEIVRRFGVTGTLPNRIDLPPSIAEFDGVFDFQSAMNLISRAKQSFMGVAPEVRALFNNDPQAFVNYVDEALQAGDTAKLQEWGMIVPKAPVAAQNGPGAPESPPATQGGGGQPPAK